MNRIPPRIVGMLIVAGLYFAVQTAVAGATAEHLTAEARGLYEAGRLKQAAIKLKAALEKRADYSAANGIMGAIHQAQGDKGEARECYRAVQRASLPQLPADASRQQAKTRKSLIRCEAVLCFELNEERLRHNLRLCTSDRRLAIAARQHSQEMQNLDYFSHKSPKPAFRTIKDRFQRMFPKANHYTLAENLCTRYAEGEYSLTAENMMQTHEDWMKSPGHRHNILHPQFRRVGVGAAVNHDGDYYVTEFLARVRM